MSDSKRGSPILLILAIAGTVWFVWKMNEPSEPAAPRQPAPKAEARTYDKSPKAEATRKDQLERAGKAGLVAKVVCRARGSDVWVTPMFDDTTMDMKLGLGVLVHQYCFNGPDDGFVRIRSNRTDKELGMYTPALGLDLE